MNKILLIGLCALAINLSAQTITNINIGMDYNSNAWAKVNNNNGTFVGWHNQQATTNAWLLMQASNANASVASIYASNFVQTSFQFTQTNINPLTFTGSNYIGHFSHLLGFKLNTPILGGNPPTNEVEFLALSYNGTSWWNVTNGPGIPRDFGTLGIMSPVYVSVVGNVGNSGTLQLYGLNQTNLWARTNAFLGQTFQVAPPVNPTDAATKAYVDAAAGSLSPWTITLDASNVTHCSYAFNGGPLADLTSSISWITIDGLVADSTQTNLLLTIAQANLFAGWHILSQTNLTAPLSQWQLWTNYICTTNTGEVTFKIPINFSLDAQFFLAQGTGTNWATFYQPVTMPELKLATFTPATAANTTWSYGAGLVAVDTNYLYITVGTNAWRRISIPTNTW